MRAAFVVRFFSTKGVEGYVLLFTHSQFIITMWNLTVHREESFYTFIALKSCYFCCSSVEKEKKRPWCSDQNMQYIDANGRFRDAASPVRQALSVGVLNFASRRNVDATEEWKSWLTSQMLHKHHSLDLSSALWSELPQNVKSAGETGQRLALKAPLTRTKSTPFELAPQSTSQVSLRKDLGSCLDLQLWGSQAKSNISNKIASNTQDFIGRGLYPQPHTGASEDPDFSSFSSDDLGSPVLIDSAVSLNETTDSPSSSVDLVAQLLDSHRLCKPPIRNIQSSDRVEREYHGEFPKVVE